MSNKKRDTLTAEISTIGALGSTLTLDDVTKALARLDADIGEIERLILSETARERVAASDPAIVADVRRGICESLASLKQFVRDMARQHNELEMPLAASEFIERDVRIGVIARRFEEACKSA